MKTIKTILVSFALMAMSLYSSATVRTCNNNNPSPGQYTTFAAVYAVSAPGDTIYLSGSATSYGNISTAEKLVIIGTGFNPTNKQDNSTSIVGTIGFTNGADGSSFIGLVLTSNILINLGTIGTINSISVIRCQVTNANASLIYNGSNTSDTLNNLLINGCNVNATCINSNANALYINNSTISNNFMGSLTSNGGSLGGPNTTFINVNIFNNDMFYEGPFADENFINCSIYNNICDWIRFMDLVIVGTNTGNSASHNVVFSSPSLNTNFNTTTQIDNVNLDPLFVNPGSGNYHLQSGSPAHNEGTDGTDAGMYGGTNPGNSYSDTGEPAIPQLRLVAAPATAGGSVNVNIMSTRKP